MSKFRPYTFHRDGITVELDWESCRLVSEYWRAWENRLALEEYIENNVRKPGVASMLLDDFQFIGDVSAETDDAITYSYGTDPWEEVRNDYFFEKIDKWLKEHELDWE